MSAGDDDRGQCTPCRGTGRVLSSLGGEPHEVTCPGVAATGAFTRAATRSNRRAKRQSNGERT